MMFLAGFAMTDTQGLKEAFTVVAPDNKPLLSVVILFGEPEAAATERNRHHYLFFVRCPPNPAG